MILLLLAVALAATACSSASDGNELLASDGPEGTADAGDTAAATTDQTPTDPTTSEQASTDQITADQASSALDATTGVGPATGTDVDPGASTADTPTPTATEPPSSTSEPTSQPRPTSEPQPTRATAPNGRTAPIVATTAAGLAAQIIEAETGLADPASTATERADFGHLHQVAIRKLGYEPSWDTTVFEALPPDIRERTVFHVSARRALIDLSSGFEGVDFIPAWEIVEPEASPNLISYYQGAGEATGIDWQFLAAINLVETGMGRIRGLSSAGAQGPMQFLPTTWNEAGIGQGDINDPNDAINAAARYLVRRGGPADMTSAIWGYNNSDAYVSAITAYAELLRRHPQAYEAIYNWEIYFFTEVGDVWLPTGMRNEETVDLTEYLANNPWSIPDSGLR